MLNGMAFLKKLWYKLPAISSINRNN